MELQVLAKKKKKKISSNKNSDKTVPEYSDFYYFQKILMPFNNVFM